MKRPRPASNGMKETRSIMSMPVSIEIVDDFPIEKIKDGMQKGFNYFNYVDENFSVFKDDSEISYVNRGEIKEAEWSSDMKEIFALSEQTKKETNGYFDILRSDGKLNPSGIVKGWAIYKVAQLLWSEGFHNFLLDVGGDIQVSGKNKDGGTWTVGIRDPFSEEKKVVKTVYASDNIGVATSGTYLRGQHIYNPFKIGKEITEIISLTVIGENIYEADRFATAAFAMGKEGIFFIENLKGFEGYMIDSKGVATMTTNFEKYTNHVE